VHRIIVSVHLIVPFASPWSAAGRDALSRLATPALDALLARCRESARDDGDEWSTATPHERVLSRALGWQVNERTPAPWAARQAALDGVEVGTAAWGLLTPVHWRVGADAVHLADPRALGLDEASSRALFDAVRPLFDSEGFVLAWGAPLRWYASHADFTSLQAAGLDRVIGRNVDRWLPSQPQARLVRRLQNEVQMLLHTHPMNQQREATGALTVNSFWLSGCGVRQPDGAAIVQVDERLSAPALAEDWPAWSKAFTALDASMLPTRPLAALTLCGERSAVTFERTERRLWQRLASAFTPRRPSRDLLETL
jgi:hypothetical protein